MGVHPYCSYTIFSRKYGSTSLLQLYYILPQIWEYILIAVIIYSPANMGVHPYLLEIKHRMSTISECLIFNWFICNFFLFIYSNFNTLIEVIYRIRRCLNKFIWMYNLLSRLRLYS